jgi:serine/threonine protein kinase
MGDLVGQSLAHFHIVEKIGEGGMGVVYRATDEKLLRTVALKVLPEALAADEQRRRRLLQEARAAAAVTHPNIASVHEVGESDGRIFVAMEYVDGEVLRRRLGVPLDLASALQIAVQIARGLAKAHRAMVVHRDLKPDNVMISDDGQVKLLDFGLAKLGEERLQAPAALAQQDTLPEVTQHGHLVGTPAYMSPEQARGQSVDARTDVYALGVVLYEMLTGNRPFSGETTQDVLAAIVRDTPARVAKCNPLVPPEIDQIVARCLEKVRDARYANGEELLEALSSYLHEPRILDSSGRQRGTSAPTLSLLTPDASTVIPLGTKRRWRGWSVFAGLVVFGVGLSYWARVRTTPAAEALSAVPAASTVAADGPQPSAVESRPATPSTSSSVSEVAATATSVAQPTSRATSVAPPVRPSALAPPSPPSASAPVDKTPPASSARKGGLVNEPPF